MQGKLNLAQIALICALGMEPRNLDFRWREGYPRVRAWFDGMAPRPSVAQTGPPVSDGSGCYRALTLNLD